MQGDGAARRERSAQAQDESSEKLDRTVVKLVDQQARIHEHARRVDQGTEGERLGRAVVGGGSVVKE